MDIGSIQPREITEELKDSYLDYAMSVIVARALPDVRDGLKPVQRRILFAMHGLGLGPQAKLRKSATVVGEVLGKYHPHGDSPVYDAMVRLAQDFSLRYPLVQGQGNFGSIDGDSPAAMRYCVTGDTLIATARGLIAIRDISPDGKEAINTPVLSRDRTMNIAVKWFDSGEHPTTRITTRNGFTLKGSYNHPILTWTRHKRTGQPEFIWKLLRDVRDGDIAVIDRTQDLAWPQELFSLQRFRPQHIRPRTSVKILPDSFTEDVASILGAFIAEGTIKQHELEFCNSDGEWLQMFVDCWRRTFPDCRLHMFTRKPSSYGKKPYHTVEVHSQYVIEFLRNLGLAPVKSRQRQIPASILNSPKSVVAAFLRAYFEGDGGISFSGKMTELSCVSTSETLLAQLQVLLLRFGIVSARRFDAHRNTYKLYIRGLGNYRLFAEQIGFLSERKKRKLARAIARLHKEYSATDFVPFFQDFVRTHLDGDQLWREGKDFVFKHNFDRYANLRGRHQQVATVVAPLFRVEVQVLAQQLLVNNYVFDPIVQREESGIERVYSLKVESPCHSFVGNGFINHNTEARLTPMAAEMLADIERDTVDFVPTYDGSRNEPTVLPAKVPQLLLNGTVGIAVGMATNIPPHNLGELVDALTYLIEHRSASVEELLKFVKGPDFPTGGAIYSVKDIAAAYGTGRGAIITRGLAEIVEGKGNSQQIIISSIPFQVNKATLIEHLAELVQDKKIEGIRDIRDESDRDGLRIAIDLKSDAPPQKVLNSLYKYTDLQKTFHLNMLALVDDVQPQVLSLKGMLEEYLKHREVIVRRRAEFDLARARERAHILEGLVKALDQIDAIIKTIRRSDDRESAHAALKQKFGFTDPQASAILDMRLQTLAGLEQEKVREELSEKRKLIKDLTLLLSDPKRILGVIREELAQIKIKYGDERKTRVVTHAPGEIKEEDLVPEEESLVILTRSGSIKRTNPAVYRTQKRGGKGVIGVVPKEEDVVMHAVSAHTHANLLFFTNTGKVFQTKTYEIPEASRQSRGKAIENFLALGPGEAVTAILPYRLKKNEPIGAKFFVMGTASGIIKKTAIEEFLQVRRSGLIAIKLGRSDTLRWVRASGGTDEVMMVTKNGQAIRFSERDVRAMGRPAAGVAGIRLRKGDEVVGMEVIAKKGEAPMGEAVLVVTENGYGKRTYLKEYKKQKRAGVGIKTAKVTRKTGSLVVAAVPAPEASEVIALSAKGQVIRTPIEKISILGRATQGVRLMKVEAGDRVAAATVF